MAKRASRVLAIAGVAAALSGGLARSQGGQEAPSLFRAGVDLVQFDVVVLDGNRSPVRGLTPDDFEVLVDGRPVEVATVSSIELPSAVAAGDEPVWAADATADVVTNKRPDRGRLVIVLMDRSIPAGPPTETARQIAKAAVEALGPNDLAAVVWDGGFANEGQGQGFTRDRGLLRRAIDAPYVGLVNPPAMIQGERPGLRRDAPDLTATGDCACGSCVTDALIHLANAVAAERLMQKTLLFVGSDIVIDNRPEYPQACSLRIKAGREEVLRALDRANMTLHSIDPTGVQTLALDASAFPGDRRAPSLQNLKRQGGLGVLPDYTGGRTVLNTNAPEAAVASILAETQSYYLVGLERGSEQAEGWRDVQVQVTREDVTVRSRRSFYGGAGQGVPPEPTTMTGLLPRAGLPLTLALTPRWSAAGDDEAIVHVGVDVSGRRTDRRLEIEVAVFDEDGNGKGGMRQTVDLPASVATDEMFEHLAVVPAEPGRFQVRVGVSDVLSGESGSVFGFLQIPGDLETGVALSGVQLQAARRTGGVSGRDTTGLASPTLRRVFAKTETVTAAVQVAQRTDSLLDPISLRAEIVDARGRHAGESFETLTAARFNSVGVATATLPLRLSHLEPGRYLLRTVAANGVNAYARHVPFEIR